jgi:hypothetical protein
LAVTVLFRALAAWSTAKLVLHDPLTSRRWWLIPVQDLMSLLVWISGFFGSTIDWRGRRYNLLPDGRFQLAGTAPEATEIAHMLQATTGPFRQHDIKARKS